MHRVDTIDNLNTNFKKTFEKEEVVLGEGPLDAKIVLIGEAPGKDEVKEGRPFVGKAGQNLNELLNVIDIPRERMYVTNLIKYRIFKINPKTGGKSNRPATSDDIIKNKDWLHRELHIINPMIVVTLGNVPLKAVVEGKITIGEVHGQVVDGSVEGKGVKVFPLYHPASIIYNRQLQQVYEEDMLTLKAYIEKLGIGE